MSTTAATHGIGLVSPLLALVPLLPLCGSALIALLLMPKGKKSSGPNAHAHHGDEAGHEVKASDHTAHHDGASVHSDAHGHAPKDNQGAAGWWATLFALAAFGIAVKLFFDAGTVPNGAISYKLWSWFDVGTLNVEFALRMDRLAGLMTLIVTGVGSLIHLYAIGYMAHDDSRARFFCYLNLFLFAMLVLVLGDNLLMMFVGWEGVGLCSYLLIGFWYKEMDNAIAGQKAFVVNRIGDAGFLLGIFTIFYFTKTLNFESLSASISLLPPMWVEIAAVLLLIGAVGKSAQFPLYIWLPDAMAGPTPVSALIHAATMVTAGVYMITKLSFLYVLAPQTLVLISCIGTFTAMLAATIAIAQNDIKKVLAYSTVSQLGYMFMALGAGAFSNGIFHVVTHAFFKACLFMGAGSVIMGCHHEQDMRRFGGLRSKMRFTFITYLIATFAIAGFPYLSGFYSKDAILWTVYSNEGLPSQIHIFGVTLSHFLWGCGAFTAFLTAFYMTRSLVLTFFGEYRGHEQPHESPWVVTLPLIILALLSAFFGWFDDGHLVHFLQQWTRPDMAAGHEALAHNHEYETLERLSMAIAVSGMALAFVLYLVWPRVIASTAKSLSFLHRALLNKWWVDELFFSIFVKPLSVFAEMLFLVIDRAIIDNFLVGGTGVAVDVGQDVLRKVHTGRINFYALMMLSCSLAFIVFWLVL